MSAQEPATPDDILARSGLRSSAAGISDANPDAGLLRDIAALIAAERTRHDAWANWNARPSRRLGTRVQAEAVFRAAAEAQDALETRVTKTAARTPEGAIAKLRHVLFMKEDAGEYGGTTFDLPLSAIRDALAHL